jgi:hypothetical protein
MVYIASNFEADEIICNVPAHALRVNLKDKKWVSDINSEEGIVDQNDNGIPISFVLLGFIPFFGNLGMRNGEEFIRIAFIGVHPEHRLLPKRCVATAIISGKSSQRSFITYFQELANNRINCSRVITQSKFVGKSFTEKDPVTGADKGKINYNVLEFNDNQPKTPGEIKLIEDISEWMETKGPELLPSVLRSHISGANLIELPLGTDHAALKSAFLKEFPPQLEGSQPEGQTPALLPADKEEPSKGKAVTLTEEQAKALGIDF